MTVDWQRQAKVVTQRRALILPTKQTSALQLGHHQLHKVLKPQGYDGNVSTKPSQAPPRYQSSSTSATSLVPRVIHNVG